MKALWRAIPTRTAVAVIAALMLAPVAMAQPRGNARLSGKVVDEQGQPLENALVTAQMTGQSDSLSGKTDKKGEWTIKGASNGEWKVEVSKEGLATGYRDGGSEGGQGPAAERHPEEGRRPIRWWRSTRR